MKEFREYRAEEFINDVEINDSIEYGKKIIIAESPYFTHSFLGC